MIAAPQPTVASCRMGSDGRQVCGWHCLTGSDGRVACADSADGACGIGADGRVVCSRRAPTIRIVAPVVGACRGSLDCGPSSFCKDRGDGIRVCMGDGGPGANCRGSVDCGGGLFCKDPGDGIRVCM